MNNTHLLYSSGDVARTVGLPRWQLLYLIEKGDLPGPSLAVPGRRLFTDEDVDRIRQAIQQRNADQGEAAE